MSSLSSLQRTSSPNYNCTLSRHSSFFPVGLDIQQGSTSAMEERSRKFLDGVNQSEESLQNFLKGDIPIKFDWANRWLKGDEYAHILNRIEEYCETFAFLKFTPKTHPECIYLQPQSKLNFDNVQMVLFILSEALQLDLILGFQDSLTKRNSNGESPFSELIFCYVSHFTDLLTFSLGKK
jgi:hypothetical protein